MEGYVAIMVGYLRDHAVNVSPALLFNCLDKEIAYNASLVGKWCVRRDCIISIGKRDVALQAYAVYTSHRSLVKE